jgi:hypothetical protein
MLDTIVLTLDQSQFEVMRPEWFSPSAKGILASPYYSLGTHGSFVCVQNPTKRDLWAGRYLPRLTLARRRKASGFALTLRIEFSAPKLIFGNNFDELESRDFEKTIGILCQALMSMGIHLSSEAVRNGHVSAIHYSKNIAFTDYVNCSMAMRDLERIDLTKRLDLSRTDYRNEGHAIRYHANSYELTFYDKIKDLEKARYSEKRSIERDYAAQPGMFRGAALMPKELEVLRMEVRLGTRTKIKNILKIIGQDIEPTINELFDARIAKAVLMHFWTHITARLLLIDRTNVRPEDMLSDLAVASGRKAKPSKLLRQLGCAMLIKSLGVRGASAVIGRYCNSRSWERYKRELKALPLESSKRFSALNQVDQCLTRFAPLRIDTFQGPKIS